MRKHAESRSIGTPRTGSTALLLGTLAVACTALCPALAAAGPPSRHGIGLQQGWVPVAWSPDGGRLAVTRWDRAGLWTVETDSGRLETVSLARGAGFEAVWWEDRLLFKEVEPAGSGEPVQRVVRVETSTGVRKILAEGPRVGNPSVSRDGHVVWTEDRTLVVRAPAGDERRLQLPVYCNLAVVSPDADRVLFNDDDGRIGVLDLRDDSRRFLTGPGAHFRPTWSPSGTRVAVSAPEDRVLVFEAATGLLLAELDGGNPRWSGTGERLFLERPATDGPELVDSAILVLDLELGRLETLDVPAGVLPRHPLPSPDGSSLTAVDAVTGDLLVGAFGRTAWLAALRVLREGRGLPEAEEPPVGRSKGPVVSMPYMHQLWDTPDTFNGNWSCGPTSCVQTTQRYARLPDHDITCSWPSSHVSPWGWYIPNLYSFGGYTYDVWGNAAGGARVQGAHGFICRDLGAAYWAYMVDFMNRHGLTSWQAGTSFSTLVSEVDADYPMVASTNVLGSGHIIVFKGYETDHSIVVNDPYGDANAGSWGDLRNGEGAVYDWPGYNNGHVGISVSQLFGAQGVVPARPPVLELRTAIDDIAGQERDFCRLYESESRFDMNVGQTTVQRLYVANTGESAAVNVVVGVWLEAPYLRLTRWDIYDNWPEHTCGAEWCPNDANDHPENPSHDDPGAEFRLHLNAFSPGETKMIEATVEAAAYSVGLVDHPDVRLWVAHVDDYYEKADFWSTDYNNVGGYQTFNGGDLRIWTETDVLDVESCNGLDDDCDGATDEDVCAADGPADAGDETLDAADAPPSEDAPVADVPGSETDVVDAGPDVIYVYVDDGCGCRAAGRSSAAWAAWLPLALLAVLRRGSRGGRRRAPPP
ncbi:MAG: C39 family peptidase [Deltaproteobacteria bacterium]|nr:C39 family peptidase [Deltaproteobacteria bacterium]